MKLASSLLLIGLTAGVSNAATIVYTSDLTGAAEAPPNTSPAVGSVTVTIDNVQNTMRVQASFSGLQGNTTAAHIHAATAVPFTGTAGVATQVPSFIGFPIGVTAGSFDQIYDMSLSSSYRAAYITANGGTPLTAFASLVSALNEGKAYFNLHSTAFPGGEIRGFPVVPEPATLSLLAGVGMLVLRRRHHAATHG